MNALKAWESLAAVEKMCGAQMRLKQKSKLYLHLVVPGGKDVWGSDEIET